MILWLILTLAVLAQCEQQPGCPDSCLCSFESRTSVEVECSNISLSDFHMDSLPPNTTLLSILSSELKNLTSAHLDHVPFLVKLQLYRTNLTSLPADLLHGLPHLHTLDLTRNQLMRLPLGIFTLNSLRNLILMKNLIEEVNPDWFPFNSSITSLDLAGNFLSSIPQGFFQRLPRLKHLDLSDNLLTELREDTLKGLQYLQEVNLMQNRLTVLHPATFNHNLKLKVLVLSNNLLHTLPDGLFHGLIRLRLLMINHNQLRSLPKGLLDGTGTLFQIFLQGNPWQCDEGLKYLEEWMKSNSHKVHYGSEVVCDVPAKLRNSQVQLLSESKLEAF